MPGDWTARLIDAPGVEGRFQVDRLLLMKSALGAGGSRYERIGEAPLA
jgi:2'-5' RNA ligase